MSFTDEKDAQAVLDWVIDWSPWLVGDELATSEWIVSGPDSSLVVDSDSNTTTAATVWLSGGTLRYQYTVTNRVATAEGRTDDRSILFTIVSK